MKTISSFAYLDRYTGQVTSEPVYAGRFLTWMYNTRIGNWFNELLLKQKFVSRLYGWYHKSRWSRRKIQSFVNNMNVNMEESLVPERGFSSFNDFFTRHIDLSRRPIVKNRRVCVAPADGRVLAFPVVESTQTFRIKQSTFNLASFLRNEELTKRFSGGSMVVSRLYLTDYHHFHFPDSGVPHETVTVPGNYYAVSSYSLRRLTPFYSENHRTLTVFDSDNFGSMVIVEVGAFTVGSIRQIFQPCVWVPKGTRKGFFELGGSTVVLLFTQGAIRLDRDLCRNTAEGIETYVRLGDSIGKI